MPYILTKKMQTLDNFAQKQKLEELKNVGLASVGQTMKTSKVIWKSSENNITCENVIFFHL